MITLRKITLENRRAIFNLEVSEDQRRFVASNLSSVASCYVLAVNGGHPFPFAIYEDELPVGFVQCCWIPYKPDNVAAKKLYESFGFRDNGEIFNDESISVLRL